MVEADRVRRVLIVSTSNGRGSDGVVVVGGEDGEGVELLVNMDK